MTAAVNLPGQSMEVDSLIKRLEKAPIDTNRVNLLLGIANKLYFYRPDLSLEYSEKALKIARDLDYNTGIISSLNLAGESYRLTGNYPKALQYQLQALISVGSFCPLVAPECCSIPFTIASALLP